MNPETRTEDIGRPTSPVIDGRLNMVDYTEAEVLSNPTLAGLLRFFGRGPEMLTSRPVEDLLAEMDETGVDRGILTGTPVGRDSGEFGPMSVSATTALEYCTRSNGRLRLGLQAETVERITRFTGLIRELAGSGDVALVRLIPSALGVAIDDRHLYPVYATCEELGLPVSVNVGIFGPHRASKYQDPLLVEDVLLDFPDLRLIGGHMGHPWEKLLIRLMMKYPNLSLMTSAFRPKYIEPEIISFMNSSRGRDKLMFGSDWPILTLRQVVPEARALPLEPPSRAGYLGGNLARLLNWD